MGLTETEAQGAGHRVREGGLPLGRLGARAVARARDEGLTKLLFEPGTRRLLGAGIVGVNAGDLIAETVLALEMGADAEDIALTDPPAPDAVRDDRVRGRDGRGHDHRPDAAAPARAIQGLIAR